MAAGKASAALSSAQLRRCSALRAALLYGAAQSLQGQSLQGRSLYEAALHHSAPFIGSKALPLLFELDDFFTGLYFLDPDERETVVLAGAGRLDRAAPNAAAAPAGALPLLA